MTLVTKAPKIGFNLNFTTKNVLIACMCIVFTGLFLYDGFYAYTYNNDRLIHYLLANNANLMSPETRELAESWKGWNNETAETRKKMDIALKADARLVNVEGWKGPLDITVQRSLALGLILASVWAIWRMVKFLGLRVEADEQMISPKRGLVIPWEKITKVDNTQWRTDGIVNLTYSDEQNVSQEVEIDEYKLDPKPLLPILDLLAEKAAGAEFLPKETPEVETPTNS